MLHCILYRYPDTQQKLGIGFPYWWPIYSKRFVWWFCWYWLHLSELPWFIGNCSLNALVSDSTELTPYSLQSIHFKWNLFFFRRAPFELNTNSCLHSHSHFMFSLSPTSSCEEKGNAWFRRYSPKCNQITLRVWCKTILTINLKHTEIWRTEHMAFRFTRIALFRSSVSPPHLAYPISWRHYVVTSFEICT